MPAKTAQLDAKFFPDEEAEYEMEHNPGLDFLRMLIQCTEAPPEKFNSVFAACSRNPIAVLLAATAVEGYTNYAGHHLCKDWTEYIKGHRSFAQKLEHVFSATEKTAKLSGSVYQQTMQLISFRGRNLAHPKFLHHKVVQKGPPPTVFDHVDADYPAAKVLKIATTFKDSLLKDLKLEDHSFRQSFVSPPGATSLSKGSGLAQLMRKKPLSK
jgi:hypothetical protein